MNKKFKLESNLRLKDQIYSFIYRLLRSEASTSLNSCVNCKKRKKQIHSWLFKPEHLIAYDKVLGEWVVFSEYNTYAKIWVMNGYITNIFSLRRKLWNKIGRYCRVCMTEYFNTYVESEEQGDEAR